MFERRTCDNPDCRVDFQPTRKDQRFHSPECRKAYWRWAYKWLPHPCPLCTAIHAPPEAPLLDELELLLDSWPHEETPYAEEIYGFIRRRRVILAGAGAALP